MDSGLQELDSDKLLQKYPLSLTEDSLITVPVGWQGIFLSLLDECEKYNKEHEEHIIILQAKEKFGEFYVYWDGPFEPAREIINKYTEQADNTCQFCGKSPAKVRTHRRWFTCLCDNCEENYDRKRLEHSVWRGDNQGNL